MELYILDHHFQPVGIVDVFSSLIWNRKYCDTGDFELHTSADSFGLLRQGAYIFRADAPDTGIIETIQLTVNDIGQREVSAKGRFLEQMLANRVIDVAKTLEGTGESVIRELVNTFAVLPEVEKRKIPKLCLGNLSQVGSKISYQAKEGALLDAIRELAVSQELSFLLYYDFERDALSFTVWQGKDRTQEQTENSWAVFSQDFENMLSTDYSYSIEDYKNYAYLAGDGLILEVDFTQGEDRREIFIDAGNVSRNTNSGNISSETYEELLKQRGLERLAEYQKSITLEGAIHPKANLIYGVDYDLGDICTFVDHELGIEANERITEITEVYENGGVEIRVAFGTKLPSIMQKMKREVK